MRKTVLQLIIVGFIAYSFIKAGYIVPALTLMVAYLKHDLLIEIIKKIINRK